MPTLRERLTELGQDHVYAFTEGLTPVETTAFAADLESIDTEALPELVESYVLARPEFSMPGDVEPAEFFALPGKPGGSWDRARHKAAGEELIRAGKVGCFTVAGGQGSRLGYDGPKGCFPAGAVSDKPLFQIFAEGVLAANRRYATNVPWYIMTSPLNHDATVAFFREHSFFGLAEGSVMFFPQGTMTSFDREGKLLLSDKNRLATNPDGHGGAFAALWNSGAVADMKTRGVEHLSYFQVDNANVRVVDPVFLGLHAASDDSSGEMSSKMCRKAYAEEKVGMFCRSGGQTLVIEYSDMPAELQAEKDENGQLRFLAGSIAIHVLSVAFIEKVATDPAFGLPWHRADKKIPHIDLKTGARVEPAEPNGVKLERFIFDAVPLAEKSVVLETDRVEEFAPIKNADVDGQAVKDSPASSKALQTERSARWLEQRGVRVPRHEDGTPACTLEISPLTATEPDELPSDLVEGLKIEPGSSHAL
ncbi:MAG: UDPGP type 1 family protein [Planctomycetota bacterium]